MKHNKPHWRIAVLGNPNVGKTSLFNRLTDSRYKTGNFPGVTVESREGMLSDRLCKEVSTPEHSKLSLIDLPGTYSLTPYAEDEAVAYRCLTGLDGRPSPDAFLIVLDATNLARNLYLALQVLELARERNRPCVVALNMIDQVSELHLELDESKLAEQLGVPIISTDARRGTGLDSLAKLLIETSQSKSHEDSTGSGPLSEKQSSSTPSRAQEILRQAATECRAQALVAAELAQQRELVLPTSEENAELSQQTASALESCFRRTVEARFALVDQILAACTQRAETSSTDSDQSKATASGHRSQQVDRVLTHKVAGPLIFVAIMGLVFQSIFRGAEPLMEAIESIIGWLIIQVQNGLGSGPLTDLLSDGVLAGVGAVVVFLPQIALLFLFIGLLEDTGYMARAAFIIDRLMARVGLNGHAFVPLLSGYACAIPAIMGTRSLRRFQDRLLTMLMIPFMSCSARLPVYTLLIGAFFVANEPVLGGLFTVGGLILLGLYLLSTLSALAIGFLYRRILFPGPAPTLLLELPPYRMPRVSDVLRQVTDRCFQFLKDAGGIILATSIVLWVLLSFPRPESDQNAGLASTPPQSAIEVSIAGRVGKAMEPALEPIGQDWRVGIGLIGSFAAREVLVSTLGLVYGIEGVDEDDRPLREKLKTAKDPATQETRYTPLSALALMIFFVYAAQCMSTLAVIRRESQSWKWPIFSFVSMTTIAYVAALLVYQGGKMLGFE